MTMDTFNFNFISFFPTASQYLSMTGVGRICSIDSQPKRKLYSALGPSLSRVKNQTPPLGKISSMMIFGSLLYLISPRLYIYIGCASCSITVHAANAFLLFISPRSFLASIDLVEREETLSPFMLLENTLDERCSFCDANNS